MSTEKESSQIEQGLSQWQAATEKGLARFPERKNLAFKRLFTPLDLKDSDYMSKVGFPGQYPFTRGVQPTMYRARHWTMRQYSGFATAEESNKRYKYLLEQGQTGLSVAFDLPTQIGYDSDHLLAQGEVGKVGVAINSLADIEALFDGIALNKVSTSMTINGPAAVLLAMYIAAGEKQGATPGQLNGTIQNDILKEYIARGTYIFPPEPSMRLITDTFDYCSKNIPKWNVISVGAYHIREAGSTAVQEVAFAFANAIAYIEAAKKVGLKVDDFAPGISWIFTADLNFLEEVAKFRAARRLWARIMKERFGATDPKSQMLRFHVHTAGSVLTSQQPDNNIARITWQAMSAILGGTQSLATCAKDEAIALPTEDSARLALRTQQLLAYESGIADTVDPFAGSYCIEALTDSIEKEAMEYIAKIDAMGGAVAAIQKGYMQREMTNSAYRYQQAIETKERIKVGVNEFVTREKQGGEYLTVDPAVGAQQTARLQTLKAGRDNAAVKAALAGLKEAAQGTDNLMPFLIDTVKTYATLGEICGVLREVFGEYKAEADI
ncbi:MAG: methylmalonyl-CoA mutase family protein [Negativicutes bacterium]|nr:methylmalonyl-CoA mutase family protein [Negativicutes bacterium]